MRPAVKNTLKQSGTNKGLSANDVSINNTIGYQPEININSRAVNLEPLCGVAPYYKGLNCLTTIGILP